MGAGDLVLLRRLRVFCDLRPLRLRWTRLLVRVNRSGVFMVRAPLSLAKKMRTYKYDAKRSLMQP